MTQKNPGTLYGIGVGPGDPELIPMKAVRILNQVHRVFAASSGQQSRSLALNVARPHIPATTPVEILPFPMSKNPEQVENAWKENAQIIIQVLQQGQDAAFLTLGDSMIFSTFGYVLNYMNKLAPKLPVKTIPGITSFQASAARLNTPLVEGDESLLVLSGVQGADRYREISDKIENIVFLKAYRNISDIVSALEETDRIDSSAGLRNCSLPDEEVIPDIRELKTKSPDYWTLIIAKQKQEDGEKT
jgi:precorrin-2/cobalt-factor-2 C20-methyltransferase